MRSHPANHCAVALSLCTAAALLVLSLVAAPALAAETPSDAALWPLESDAQRLPYALGLIIGGKLAGLRLGDDELLIVERGLTEASESARPILDPAEWSPKVTSFAQRRQEAVKKAGKDKDTLPPAAAPERTLYAMGVLLGSEIHGLGLTAAEEPFFHRGLADAAAERSPQLDLTAFTARVQAWAKSRQEASAGREAAMEKEASRGFLAKASLEPGAETTPSGLIYRLLRKGSGASPQKSATVKVHYEGKLLDGTVFDSSRRRGEPAVFPLTRVIRCWTEGLAKMKLGELAQLICPSSIAYGDVGQPPSIPPGATLVFEVELLGIEGGKPGAPDPAAAALAQREASKGYLVRAAAEPGVEKTPSGALFRLLTAGAGASPSAQSTVTVHYQGRLIDGAVFEDTRKRGSPLTFPLSAVIKCWSEGMIKMKIGAKAQLTCPSEAAYGDAGQPPSVPGGAALVFEVELLSIEN